MPFAQLMAVLPLRDVACSLRVPSNPNGLKYNKDENETVIAHRSDCGLFLFRQKKGVRQWMSNSKLIELSYYDPSAQVRLSAYADTLVSQYLWCYRIQIHNERYRLTKKDVRSNLERCLDMVKAQFPDKEPLIQKMIRSIR